MFTIDCVIAIAISSLIRNVMPVVTQSNLGRPVYMPYLGRNYPKEDM